MSDRFLVTGAMGCIGAWTVCCLVREQASVVVLDLDPEPRRLRLLLTPEELSRVTFVPGDITELDDVEQVLDRQAITHVIHLAALQVPFCRADPPLGARVNVVGTVNLFEAIKRRQDQIRQIVYASSMAVFGNPSDYGAGAVLRDDTPLLPRTHYGVYKRANEGTAKIYWQDDGIPSLALRPYTVYGVGRDQGMTSTPTTAMLAAAAGRPYRISFGGRSVFQYAEDTARALILCARMRLEGAVAYNFSGPAPHMREVVSAIEAAAPESRGKISFEDVEPPVLADVDGSGFEKLAGDFKHRPLQEGVAETVSMFRSLVASGMIDPDRYLRERS